MHRRPRLCLQRVQLGTSRLRGSASPVRTQRPFAVADVTLPAQDQRAPRFLLRVASEVEPLNP